jgi:hypothetical protein
MGVFQCKIIVILCLVSLFLFFFGLINGIESSIEQVGVKVKDQKAHVDMCVYICVDNML